MEPIEEQVAYKSKVYRCLTSKGTMDDLVTVLNRYHYSDNIIYIEPMIWKSGEVVEYGYCYIVKGN